jgi:signal transduction histidine kinase
MSVADDGVGMDAATQQRVFEPFFTRRADNDRTGPGVSIVNGIVRAHGGSIAVHSAPGQGPRFDLLFPLRARHVGHIAAARAGHRR